MAKQFNVSRTTVSAWVKQLTVYGLTINRVKGRGYRLIDSLQLLDQSKIRASLALNVREPLSVIDIAADTESTNRSALMADYRSANWKLFASEYQSAGRGRRGRQWISPFGSSLLFSLGKKSYWHSSTLYGASIILGIAVARSLQCYTDAPVKIKWPNDIYVHDSKVAGILCEMQGNPTDEALLVVGVGLNLFSSPALSDKATVHLSTYASKNLQRNELLGHLVSSIINALEQAQADGAADFTNWPALDYLHGKSIEVHKGGQVLQGIATGIDSLGQLQLKRPTGELMLFNGGEVSVRW